MKKTAKKVSEPLVDDFIKGSWKYYSIKEMGDWVYLLSMRATHHLDEGRQMQDLRAARVYLGMMSKSLDEIEEALNQREQDDENFDPNFINSVH